MVVGCGKRGRARRLGTDRAKVVNEARLLCFERVWVFPAALASGGGRDRAYCVSEANPGQTTNHRQNTVKDAHSCVISWRHALRKKKNNSTQRETLRCRTQRRVACLPTTALPALESLTKRKWIRESFLRSACKMQRHQPPTQKKVVLCDQVNWPALLVSDDDGTPSKKTITSQSKQWARFSGVCRLHAWKPRRPASEGRSDFAIVG